MSCERSFQQRAIAMLPRFVFVLLLIQPLLDVLSYWMDVSGMPNTLTLALRFAMLALILVAGYTVSRKRRVYWAAGCVLLLLTGGHIFACLQTGYDAPLKDLTNLLRIYQLPIATISFVSFLRVQPRVLETFRKGMVWNLGIIALVVLASVLTDTNPYTYPNKELGYLGWFYFANSQSAILSAVAPIAIAWSLEHWQDRPGRLCLTCFVSLALLYLLGTRLSYLALFATGIGLVITLLLTRHPGKRNVALLLACTLVFLALFPLSPMYRNQMAVKENAVKKQAHIDTLVAGDEAAALDAGLSGQELKLARLSGAYDAYLGGLVERFGLERVAARYGYSDRASDLADVRRMRVSFCAMSMEDAPLSTLLFGLELNDLTYQGTIYDVENDLHGIFFLCGASGLALMVLFLGYFLYRILRAMLGSWRRYFTLPAAGFGIAFLTCLTHVYATAGVLRRPNASVYLAVTLACIFSLTARDPGSSRLPERE